MTNDYDERCAIDSVRDLAQKARWQLLKVTLLCSMWLSLMVTCEVIVASRYLQQQVKSKQTCACDPCRCCQCGSDEYRPTKAVPAGPFALCGVDLVDVATNADAPQILVPVRVLRILDGDTFTADLLFPWGVTLRDQSIRCLGYDAWETSRRRQSVEVTDAEIERGKQAKAAFEELLSQAETVFIAPGNAAVRDHYGRVLGRPWVWKDGELIDVAEWMKANGHVRDGPDA